MEGKYVLGIGLILCMITTAVVFLMGIALNPAFEDKCRILINEEFGYQITDSGYVDNLMQCKNYFGGHIIAEYWDSYIGIGILISIIVSLIYLLVIAEIVN